MLSLSYATHSDIPALQQLMQLVFDDEQPFLESLFGLKFNDNVLIYKDEDRIIAMAFLLPAYIRIEGKLEPVTYIYACATHPDYRNNGLMHNVLNEAWQAACARQEVGVFLRPASDTLYDYYEKEGFRTFFYKNTQTVNLEEYRISKNGYTLTPLSVNDYHRWRTLLLPDNYTIHWDIAHLELVAAHPEFGEADYYAFQENGQTVAIACIQQDTLRTNAAELLLCPTAHPENIYQAISQHFKIKNSSISTQGKTIRTGMIKMNPTFHIPQKASGYMAFGIE
jgi:GNAT superfamily N-acetyltransferase